MTKTKIKDIFTIIGLGSLGLCLILAIVTMRLNKNCNVDELQKGYKFAFFLGVVLLAISQLFSEIKKPDKYYEKMGGLDLIGQKNLKQNTPGKDTCTGCGGDILFEPCNEEKACDYKYSICCNNFCTHKDSNCKLVNGVGCFKGADCASGNCEFNGKTNVCA